MNNVEKFRLLDKYAFGCIVVSIPHLFSNIASIDPERDFHSVFSCLSTHSRSAHSTSGHSHFCFLFGNTFFSLYLRFTYRVVQDDKISTSFLFLPLFMHFVSWIVELVRRVSHAFYRIWWHRKNFHSLQLNGWMVEMLQSNGMQNIETIFVCLRQTWINIWTVLIWFDRPFYCKRILCSRFYVDDFVKKSDIIMWKKSFWYISRKSSMQRKCSWQYIWPFCASVKKITNFPQFRVESKRSFTRNKSDLMS